MQATNTFKISDKMMRKTGKFFKLQKQKKLRILRLVFVDKNIYFEKNGFKLLKLSKSHTA